MRPGAVAWQARPVPLRCLIVDDNADFLRAAQELLERDGLEVVGLATSGADALNASARLQPDVVLIDLYLAGESGFDLARRFAFSSPPAAGAVILISTYAERDFGELITSSPAIGFLTKGELSGNSIRTALRQDHTH